MLPERKRDLAESEGGGHTGFEVRVIGGSAPIAVEPPEDNGSGVEVGVVIGGGAPRARQQAAAAGESPVLRLEAEDQAEPLKARAMSEVGPAVPRTSSRKKKRDRLQQLTLWMAVAVCGVAIVTVAVLMSGRKDQVPDAPAAKIVNAEPMDAAAAERERFVEDSDKLIHDSEQVLRRFAAAGSAEEALPLLRDPEEVKSEFLAKWKPWGAAPAFASSQVFEWSVESLGIRPSITVSGVRGDFAPFRMVFVHEAGKMLIDWRATAGAGDLDISDLTAGMEAKNAVIRAVISSANHFTMDFPEDRYHSYRLADRSGDYLAWAFAEIGSPAAEMLGRELNEGSVLMDAGDSIEFTLKVSGPAKSRSTQYLVTEMLHKGWVSP